MAGETYGSPGSAFTYGIDDFLINQQKLEHQKLMDSLDVQREKRLEQQDNLDLQLKQAELEDRKAVNAQTVLSKKVESVQKRADELAPGDIPSAQLIHDAQEIGYPLRLGAAPTMATVPAGQQAPQMPGGGTAPFGPAMTAPAQAMTDPSQRPFLGSPKQQQLDALMGTLTSADPATPEFKKAAIQYELVSGRSLPAAAFTPTKTTDTEAVLRQRPNSNIVERLQNGQWVPIIGDAPKGAHWINEPDPALEAVRALTLRDKQIADAAGTVDLTPGALDMIAEQVAKSGKGAAALSGLGWGNASKGEKTSILNRAAQYDVATGKFRDQGGSPPDLAAQGATFTANEAALRERTRAVTAAQASQRAASDNLDLALASSPKVTRTDSQWINHYTNEFVRGATSAKELTDFEVKIYAAAREYAKVVSGSSASVAGLSDTAAREASKLLNSAQSPEAFQAAVAAMKADMANYIKNQQSAVDDLKGSIARPNTTPTGTRKSPADLLKEVTGAR